MRILQLIQKAQNRGAETFACQLSNHLKKDGHEIMLLAVFHGEGKLPWEGKIYSLNASGKFRFLDFKAWKSLNNYIKDFNPDIVQANSGDTLKYAVLSKIMFGWKTPIVFRNASEVGQYLNSELKKRVNKFLYQNVERVASVSETSKNDFINQFPFIKNNIEVIPIGLEEKTEINEVKLNTRANYNLIHVGGFTFEKNHTGLLKIFQKIEKDYNGLHLHLVGDGPLRNSIEKMVIDLSLEDKVTFHGFVNNPLSYIKSADLLVLPSIIEGLPGVLLEAMYCKTPVIAYDVGGISEIVNSNTGILIPKHNESLFSEAILNVLENDSNDRVNNAYEMVTTNYMNSKISEKFQNLYSSI